VVIMCVFCLDKHVSGLSDVHGFLPERRAEIPAYWQLQWFDVTSRWRSGDVPECQVRSERTALDYINKSGTHM